MKTGDLCVYTIIGTHEIGTVLVAHQRFVLTGFQIGCNEDKPDRDTGVQVYL